MAITKEQQEALVNNYVKEKHTQEECIGFIDGVEKSMSAINSQLISFCYWYKHTDFNCEGNSSEDCVNEYIKSITI